MSATSATAIQIDCPCSGPKSAGSSTIARTVKMSSTTSQPTAMCPAGVCSALLSDRTRTTTTVLATASAMPNTVPPAQPHPIVLASSAPNTVATVHCRIAPGTATPRTASSSST